MTSVYVKLSCVVPAGTVGGSVNKTAKVASSTVGTVGVVGPVGDVEAVGPVDAVGTTGVVLVKFANKDTTMIATATMTAAKPYLKVHLLYIFLPLHNGKSRVPLKPTHFKVR